MENERINALISLLDDPNDEIFLSVEGELLKEETGVISLLEQAWASSDDGLCQLRIENIIHNLQLKDLRIKLKQWVVADDDLLRGAWLVARYHYPDLTYEQVNQIITSLRKDIWMEIHEPLSTIEKVSIINHVLFDVHGFKPNSSHLIVPQNAFICDVLHSKKGNPVTLGVVYLVIAQLLGLPVYGVNLPKTFLLACLDDSVLENMELFSDPSSVLFYINPANKGAVLGRREIEVFISRQKLESQESYFVPCSNTEIVRRMFNDLFLFYEGKGKVEKSEEIRKLITLLDETNKMTNNQKPG